MSMALLVLFVFDSAYALSTKLKEQERVRKRKKSWYPGKKPVKTHAVGVYDGDTRISILREDEGEILWFSSRVDADNYAYVESEQMEFVDRDLRPVEIKELTMEELIGRKIEEEADGF